MFGCVFPSLPILQMCGDSPFGDYDVHRQLSDSFHLDDAAYVIHHMPWFFHHLQKMHTTVKSTHTGTAQACVLLSPLSWLR